MSIVVCPKCSNKNRTPDGFAGRRVRCAICGHGFLLPEPSASASEAILLEPVGTSEDTHDVYRLVDPETPASDEGTGPLPGLPAIPRRKSRTADGRRTGSRPDRQVPSSTLKYAVIGAACFVVVAASVAALFFVVRRAPSKGLVTDAAAAPAQPAKQESVPAPPSNPSDRKDDLKGQVADGQPAANETEQPAKKIREKPDRWPEAVERNRQQPVADVKLRREKAREQAIARRLAAMTPEEQVGIAAALKKVELMQPLTQAEVDLLTRAGYMQGEFGQRARALASRKDNQPAGQAETSQAEHGDTTAQSPKTPDPAAENERLYLAMLIQGHDAYARDLRGKIATCEQFLANRKHRSAQFRHAEPDRVQLGDGDFIDLTPDVKRQQVEGAIEALNQKLESVENGSTLPDDRYWDPPVFPKFGRLGGIIRVLQVIGPSDMLIDMRGPGFVVWIAGVSTANRVDDQDISFGDQLFLADGTKSYTNTVGARATVRLLRPFVFDRNKVIAEYRAQLKGGAAPVSPAHSASIPNANADSASVDSAATTPKRPGTASEKLTEDEQRYLSAIIQARDARVEQLRQAIGQAEPANAASGKKKPGTPLKDVQAELADLESGKRVVEPGFVQPRDCKVGTVMGLRGLGQLKVIRVSGPSDMVVMTDARDPGGSWDRLIWLHGFPTRNVDYNQRLVVKEPIVSDHTKTYDTAAGTSRTVFIWRRLVIDREKVLAQYRARSKPAEPEATANGKAGPKVAPGSKADGTPAEPADPDAAAHKHLANLLKSARALIKDGLRERPKYYLQRIIQEAPGTSLAKDAQKELDQLGDR